MTTSAPQFTISDTFPPASYDEWRVLAEAALKGAPFEKKLVKHTYEGLQQQPVYTQDDLAGQTDGSGWPGSPPYVRGATPLGAVLAGWDFRQEYSLPDPIAANAAILADVRGGVTSIHLKLDSAARAGFDPDVDQAQDLAGRAGSMFYHLNDLEAATQEVSLAEVGVSLEAGAAFLPAAALMAALWQQRQLATDQVRGAFNADPFAELARQGILPYSLDSAMAQLSDLAGWTSANYPHATAVGVDTSPYHHAGATAAQDLAFAMATAVQYLRAMADAGMDINDAAQQILFRISLGTHQFLAIAKLRAGRRLWSRLVEACGGTPEAAAMKIHARISDRVLTRHDPYVNLLRNTVSVFAAGIGGADAITSVPFDYLSGATDGFSRRVARNTGLVLQEEAHLNRVVDPAGGSWYLESLTNQIAQQAWGIFQDVERQGGMLAALAGGWVAEQIEAARVPRDKDIATRKAGITGVSEFPDLSQEELCHATPNREELRKSASQRISKLRQDVGALSSLSSADHQTATLVAAAAEGASLGQLAVALGFQSDTTTMSPLSAPRFAEPYEQLRDAVDAWRSSHKRRPCVFLANLGPIAHHTARATYSKSFFEAGGFEVVTNSGFQNAAAAVEAFQQSGATIAVLCSSDKLYPDFVPEVAAELKAAGARSVVLAGKPGENESSWRAAGVDRFIYRSCNVLDTLRELLEEEGVLVS
ncbi:MAG: methylmalonyl-CoA mutase family protein [Bythopirellula sp.]